MTCRHRTKSLFNTLNSSAPATSIRAYSDGSKSSSPETTTCAIFISALNKDHAWTLTKGSRFFTAEVTAIYQALKLFYDMGDCPPEAIIYSDSSSAITAISSNSLSENEAVTATRKIIASLKSSGTRTRLTWIPSHTGIEGNERADRLAATECKTQDGEEVHNSLSPKEMVSIIRANWATNLLRNQKTCKKSCIQRRSRLGTIKWHQHPNRQVAMCQHRLRSGHNQLNAFSHRMDSEADPSCRFGCAAIENARHILESCSRNEEFRLKIRQFFSDRNLELNASTMLGLNPTIDADTQFKIRNLTTQFLTQQP
jgi:ribonuclease HI